MFAATISISELLKIPVTEPERFFSGPEMVASEYKIAAKRLHPDLGGDNAALAHLNVLHDNAENKIKNGEWLTPGLLILKGDDGKEKRIRFLKEFDANIGRGYLGKTMITYVIGNDLSDLAENAKKVIKSFENAKYPNDRIKTDIEYRRPKLKKFFKTKDGKSVLIVEKPEDVIRLRDVWEYFSGKLDPRHVAWIMSEMHNLACWLEHIKLTHNDLSIDSLFISPSKHSVMILGGWWFAAPEGERMQRIQVGRTVANAPQSVLNSKKACIKTDLTLIRLLGRELLGDENGINLTKDKSISPVLANWLRFATTGNAKTDYKLWEKTLTDAFGKRVFTKLELQSTDIYKE